MTPRTCLCHVILLTFGSLPVLVCCREMVRMNVLLKSLIICAHSTFFSVFFCSKCNAVDQLMLFSNSFRTLSHSPGVGRPGRVELGHPRTRRNSN